jgi:hypothetical protein
VPVEPERWQRIERLYHTALELEPGPRGAYLQEACGADKSLLHEIESLLANEEQAQSFIEEPALQIAARDLAANPRGSCPLARPLIGTRSSLW